MVEDIVVCGEKKVWKLNKRVLSKEKDHLFLFTIFYTSNPLDYTVTNLKNIFYERSTRLSLRGDHGDSPYENTVNPTYTVSCYLMFHLINRHTTGQETFNYQFMREGFLSK